MSIVTPLKDGPLKVEGARLETGPGQAVDKPVMFLCRCGHSANKPFCDGRHRAMGFQSEAPATTT
jgi:CDGSH-type Zn-finger protein